MTPSLSSTRIRLPDDPAWQGILYLDLTVHEAPPAAPTATLVLHLAQDHDQASIGGIQARDVEVSGGRRVVDLAYTVTFPTSDTIQLDFPAIGDHSTYTVALLSGGLRSLHPFAAQADFRFTLDCPGGDCRPAEEEAEAPIPPRPAIDLLTKDYRGFVTLLAQRAQVVDPEWGDTAPAAFERVLIDLLAYVGDRLSYHQDRVANEAFVETASQRWSLDQHALLLGVPTHPGEAATLVLAFDVGADDAIPAGLEVHMIGPGDEAPVAFHVLERTVVRPSRNRNALVFAGWPGADDATIPVGSTDLRLWGADLPLEVGSRLAFLQDGAWQIVTVTAVEELSEPGWTDSPSTAVLSPTPVEITRITLDTPTTFALAPWGGSLAVHANLVDARHGTRRVARVPPASATSRTEVEVTLDRWNSTVVDVDRGGTIVRHLRQLRVPGGPVLWRRDETDREGGFAPLLEVSSTDETWTRQEHLHSSRSFDRHFVAEVDNDGGLWLRFGDGVHGRELEVLANGDLSEALTVVWWTGDPVLGNVPTLALGRAIRPAADLPLDGFDFDTLVAVTNVSPGAGGRAADSLDQIRERIPESIRHGIPDAEGVVRLQRAVTLADYARAAEDVDGVARAVARSLRTPFNTVLVLVDPENDDELSEAVRADVQAHLDEVRMAGREVVVRQADFVPLEVSLAVCADEGYPRHEVRARVYAALRPGTDTNPGWFHPDRLSFGESVELGELLAFVQGIDGVCSVRAFVFKPLLRTDTDDVLSRIELSSTEVARLDGDDDFPENGRLLVRVVGLDLPDADAAAYQVEASP